MSNWLTTFFDWATGAKLAVMVADYIESFVPLFNRGMEG